MTSGFPHTVEFFKPGDDPDSAKPAFTVPFMISVPSITIDVSAAPSFDELVGFYEDGVMTITDVFVSDEFRASLASTADKDDDEVGCDLSEMLPQIEAQKGVPNDKPFTIIKTDENAGILQLSNDDDGDGFVLQYSPASGTMTAHYEEDGSKFDGVFTARYNGDKTGVEISGDVVTDLGVGTDNFKMTIRIEGSKPLS